MNVNYFNDNNKMLKTNTLSRLNLI